MGNIIFGKQRNAKNTLCLSFSICVNIQAFPKIDDSANVSNKGLCREEQNKFSQKSYLHWGLNLGPQDSSCGTSCVALSYLSHCANLALLVRLRLLGSLYNHALLISITLYKS